MVQGVVGQVLLTGQTPAKAVISDRRRYQTAHQREQQR